MAIEGNILRQSQVVTTFGPGSLVDLPRQSVIIGGLDDWRMSGRVRIREPRLEAKLRALLGVPALELYEPPAHDDDAAQQGAPPRFVAARVFPRWYATQEPAAGGGGLYRRRRLIGEATLSNGQYRDPEDNRRKPVVPVRFVAACARGHVEDVDWRIYVHRGVTECTRTLWIEERGTSGDVADVVVGCDCKLERKLLDAVSPGTRALGLCDGQRPWLGPFAREACSEYRRLLIRTASNAYFPELMSVISLPDEDDALKAAVDRWWTDLQGISSAAELPTARKYNRGMAGDLGGSSDDELMAAIQRRNDGRASPDNENVKPAEFDVMASGKARLGRNDPESVFYMETLDPTTWRTTGEKLLDSIRRVVVIPRLREVVAQSGFTRFDALAPDEDGELDMGVERAALARALTWLPAVEHKGEGIFVQFDAVAVDAWRGREAVKVREVALRAGYDAWRKDRPNTRRDFPGVAYVMMHSLAHMLLTTIALESGYAASSLRERIYGNDGRYGILIYTATSGAEGTLGGLVATALNIGTHLARALKTAVLCSNDPVCAEHKPDDRLSGRPLHGAACHGCLLIAETSCEQRNDFLDRALVVATVAGDRAAFFSRSAIDGSDA
jgi:Domain of unknown function (DUF1998)